MNRNQFVAEAQYLQNIRFPPQKATGQDAHSPLSPLTQTSPLYPDGLIAPIWVRKHIELLPSVFVLFLRLFESTARPPNIPISPLHAQSFSDKVRLIRCASFRTLTWNFGTMEAG